MSDEPMVPPEATAMIGQETRRGTGVVYQKEAQRWAAAVGDLNPRYFDAEAAAAEGFSDTPIPPLFVSQVMQGVTIRDGLRHDGIPGGGGGGIPLNNAPRRMAGGEEYEFIAPIYPGDTLTAVTHVANIEEKTGRSGRFVLMTSETTYTNQHGDVVVRSRMSTIAN